MSGVGTPEKFSDREVMERAISIVLQLQTFSVDALEAERGRYITRLQRLGWDTASSELYNALASAIKKAQRVAQEELAPKPREAR